jgi:16S rRNA (guanine966-N2)-methyltransferase
MTGAQRKKSSRALTGEVRIIAGTWRSRRIRFPSVEGLRPTPDRVRETLFNWLGHDLEGFRCLDLYAGSGALGFEAVSRGAGPVVMIERDGAAYRALDDNAKLLGAARLELVRGDALEFVKRLAGAVESKSSVAGVSPARRFDLVFLDPPFGAGVPDELLPLLRSLLAPGARIYIESGCPIELPEPWVVEKNGRAGQVYFQLLRLETA